MILDSKFVIKCIPGNVWEEENFHPQAMYTTFSSNVLFTALSLLGLSSSLRE